MSGVPVIVRRMASRLAPRFAPRLASGIRQALRGKGRGASAITFAVSALPLMLLAGLAVDYGFYVRAQSQLNLAADAAAMHAVRVASQAFSAGQTTVAAIQQAGQTAGQQWFASQLRELPNGSATPVVNVTYTPTPSTFTATVSYTGSVLVNFSKLFNVTALPISGTATASISNSYVEVLMLLDNSSSMLIGASISDILALQAATPCSTQGKNEGQAMSGNYSWAYTGSYGYGSNDDAPPAAQNGSCDSRYTGDSRACSYAPSYPNISTTSPYRCTNGGGSSMTVKGLTYPNMPNAPCAFACHNKADNTDYYGLARSLNPPIQLRLDVVQQAAANVISTLQGKQEAPKQFSVGVYQFNSSLQQLYPSSGEAGTDLATALTLVQNVRNTPPLTVNDGNSNFPAAAQALAQKVTAAGDGTTPAKPIKNLFIVTDGMENNGSTRGPMTSATNEQLCSLFWNNGFNVYVLYTPYLPLPNPFYLDNVKQYAEPLASSPNVAALKACARKPAHFFQASDPDAINTAMQNMLATALLSPGRIAN